MYGDGQWGVPGYTAIRELGTGATGRVVLARRDYDGVEVAIKYLSEELRSDVGFVARFRHEARLLATVQSVHHARLLDYVETGQGAAIIMELINGLSLRELLRSEGPTGPEAALVVLKGSLQGLASAHAIGIVHRDFKPENVMIQGDGTSKLVDFGIAVRAGEGASAAGTPPYMAPEQWSGGAAGPATDVYAATIVFFECLTGTRPFRAANVAALARQHQSAAPPVEEVPAPLRGLMERGLAKDPAGRPPSAEAFLTELEAVAAEGYGSDWEERGRRRLAALAGLLAVLFPSALDEPGQTVTSLARTRFPNPSQLLGKLPAKIAVAATAVGAVTIAAVLIANASAKEPLLEVQAGLSTPTTSAPTSLNPVETEEPPPTLEEVTPTPSASPTATDAAAPPPTRPASTRPARTRSPRPTPTRVRQPARTRTPTRPAATPSPTASTPSDQRLSGGVEEWRDTRPPRATPTPEPSTVVPTTRPTRPTDPPQTPTEGPGEGTPKPTGGEQEPPRGELTPRVEQPRGDGAAPAPAALIALGLVTSGALPVTLAVRRRMAGRHRRKR
ncbi:serine/threonine-protein kinase [Nonomuraea jiangxiensis]|uniref:non-specific serine/threonine protein kinase n=1 Tax=Nonomuraea jiangxiensis TaxID=633440 RepID=A0A1G9A8I0_9ACTN|nr:serine/threonine-protein kinase [Nonomuraea jiangxiensis]SDK23649.1 serine/threonine protein kinase [Nonomuraea jiangxiensis]